jgi:soluble lytic murein transglycosylase-like protein
MAIMSFMKKSVGGAFLLLAAVSQGTQARTVKPAVVPSAYQQEQVMTPTQLMLRWQLLVAKASHRAGVPVAWINAVMRVESGGRTMLSDTQPMISAKGALGLMQVLPQTYQDMKVQYKLGPDPFAPKDNIGAGAGYLRWLRAKYGYPTMFAAYNAGPGEVDDVLGGHRQLPAETRSYVARVAQILGERSDGAFIDAAKFTRPDGTAVLIDPLAVSAIRAAAPGEYPDGVLTVLSMGRMTQGVREDIGAATVAIRIRGGKV